MTYPHCRFALVVAVAALTVSCGGGVTLPQEGEAAALELVDGDDQVGPAGTALAEPVVVRVTDTQGRPVPSHDVTFVIATGGGTVTPEAITTGTDGLATAQWTLGAGAGEQSLRARTQRGGSGSTLLEVMFTAEAVAGSGSLLARVDGDEQVGPVNSALADSLVVRATDALGNPVAGVGVAWTVSGGGSISPATVVTGADGIAAAERVLGPTAGAQSAQATVDGFAGSPVVFTHTAEPANPTALVLISGSGQSAPGGFEVAEDLVVRLEDPNGNGIGGRPITWVVPSGSGSVQPVSTTTNANGLAATRWTLPTAVGTYNVNAVFSGLPPVVFSATATADQPTAIVMVSGNGQSAAVGAALTNPLVVRVTDASDNPVAGVPVTWAAVGGGTVNGEATTTTGTDASGLAQVTRVLGLDPQQYTTTAAVGGLDGSPVTFVSTATVGSPAKLAIVQAPGASTVSGSAFDPQPIIQVQDAQGNAVPQGGIPVIANITSGQSGATLENEQRNTNASGRVGYTNLRISGPPDNDYVLEFTAAFQGVPLASVSTGALQVTAGGATRLILTVEPSSTAQSGVVLARQPTVQVVDATGNPVVGSRTITASIGEGGGTLEGDVTVSTGSGSTATFTDLAISGTVGVRTLLFSSGALTPGESDAINLVTGPAASIAIQVGDDQTATAGAEVPTDPAVIIRDSGGNPVSGVEVTFSADNGGSVGSATATTGTNGVASTSWTLGTTPGPNELTATSPVGSVTFTANGTAEATTTSLDIDPDSPTTTGTQVTFTATVLSDGGTPTGAVEFRNGTDVLGSAELSGGIATFQTTTLAAGQYNVSAHYLGEGVFGASQSSAVAYEVAVANTSPAAGDDSFSVAEDAVLGQPAPGVLANDTDADGDDLTAQLVGEPANGDVALNQDGSFTYTPDPDFNGSDGFTYRAGDGQATSEVATVTIDVTAVNDDPGFTAGGDIVVDTAEARDFASLWATGVDPGPPDEEGQAIAFVVTLDDPADTAAFLERPEISANGTLSFTTVALDLAEPKVIPFTVVLEDELGGESQPADAEITVTLPLTP